MSNPGFRQKQTDQLRQQGYFGMSPEERSKAQKNALQGLRMLKSDIRKSAQQYAREVRKDEQ